MNIAVQPARPSWRVAFRIFVAAAMAAEALVVACSPLVLGERGLAALLPFVAWPVYLASAFLAARVLWPDEPRGLATLVAGFAAVVLTVAGFVGYSVLALFTLGLTLCGADGSTANWTIYTGGAAFVVLATPCFLGPLRRLALRLPLALAGGLLVAAVATVVDPANHGHYCED